jgi:ferric-dicitrate binding protein FerR (iron transport regulator)
MMNLDKKYRRDELSPEELKTLRETLQPMPDEDLGQAMYESWMNEEPDLSRADPARMARMKRRIDRHPAMPRRPARTLLAAAARIAAAILLPLLALGTLYFYHESRRMDAQYVTVSTARGERTNVTLPDGTCVTLNVESELRYAPARYSRQVSLEGEAFFRISRDAKRPFRIEARNLRVTVTGTAFNLRARREGTTAELALEEGCLHFASLRTGCEVALKPGQKAILDHSSGEITVLTGADIPCASAWKRGELVFRNTPLADVLEALRENYGIAIETDCRQCLTDTFTGTVTNSDLNETLDIIEKTYRLSAVMRNGTVYLIQTR